MEEAYLRAAAEEDMDLIFGWANEPAVRANSFSSSLITHEEHEAWFQRLMASGNRRQYIYMLGGEPVGQARVEVSGEEAEISYSICAGMRGMGHGKNMLQLLRSQVKEDFPEAEKLKARVKPDNIASRKAFLNAGYAEAYEVYELQL